MQISSTLDLAGGGHFAATLLLSLYILTLFCYLCFSSLRCCTIVNDILQSLKIRGADINFLSLHNFAVTRSLF